MYKISRTCQIKNLNTIYLKYFDYPSNGFFVEVGAYDGESFSNTSCLADHGWKGIYVEPVKSYFQKCSKRHTNKNVKTVNCSIGTQEGEIDLYVGGALTTSDPEQVKRYSEIDWSRHIPFSKDKCTQVRLDTLLEKYNVQPGFEILCVDVEGRESDVFDSFDLKRWNPKMMIVELEDKHKSFQKYVDHIKKQTELREKINSNGYVEIFRDHINTIFVRNDFYKTINSK